MAKRAQFALRVASALMVAAAYLALASVRTYGAGVLFVPLLGLIIMPVCERLDARYPGYREVSQAACFLCLLLLYPAYTLIGRMDTVIILVMFIQLYVLLHKKDEKAYHVLFLMSFFLLLSACVQSPDASIAPVMLIFIVAASSAFAALRLVEEMKAVQGMPALPGVLRLDGTAPARGRRARRFDPGMLALFAALPLATVLMTIAAFPVLPRFPAGMLGKDAVDVPTTGLSEIVELDESYLEEDDTPVMYVQFPDEPGGIYAGGSLLWRSTTFPRFSGSTWTRDKLVNTLEPTLDEAAEIRAFRGSGQSKRRAERPRRPNTRLVRQVIYLENAPKDGLPCLDLVQRLELTGNNTNDMTIRLSRQRDYSISFRTTGSRRLTYDAWSEIDEPSPDELRKSPTDYREVIFDMDYRMLTHQELLPETIALAENLLRGENTVYDKARTLERWLSGPDFEYSLERVPLPKTNRVDFFVRTLREGHCEMFASAMALMLRSQGIPTRIVSGYRGGETDEAGASYIIRASMAHLWVEVWFPTYGWIVFDPSPRSAEIELTPLSKLAKAYSQSVLKMKMLWMREVEGFTGGMQMDWIRDVPMAVFTAFQGEGAELAAAKGLRGAWDYLWRTAFFLAVLLLLLISLLLTARHWANTRVKRAGLSKDQVRAALLYKRLRHKLERSGAECAGKTAEELHQDLLREQWVDVGPGIEILEAYNAARFGKRPMPRDRYARLQKRIRALRPQTG